MHLMFVIVIVCVSLIFWKNIPVLQNVRINYLLLLLCLKMAQWLQSMIRYALKVNDLSCYNPILGIPHYEDRSNKQFKLIGRYDPALQDMYPGSVSIPCGKCIGCRLDYSRQWADRMLLEYENTRKAVFCTLTYNQEHVPIVEDEYHNVVAYTLEKEDFQLFMKRLRSRKCFEDREIRFFASGEYGTNTKRPHYHCILFNLDLRDLLGDNPKEWKVHSINKLKQPVFISDLLTEIWQNGFTAVSDVSWNTFAYCARYVLKKVYGDDLPHYLCDPEFSLMSRRPGIGAPWFLDHGIKEDEPFIISSGKKISMPRYFKKLVEKYDQDMYNRMKEAGSTYARDAALRKLYNTDLSYIEVLENEENLRLCKSKSLMQRL